MHLFSSFVARLQARVRFDVLQVLVEPMQPAVSRWILCTTTLCAALSWSNAPAGAYPFEPNSRSFTAWANQITYSDGFRNKRYFYNLSNCSFWRSKQGAEVYELARCTGFYTETTRLGVRKRCVSDHITYERRISPVPGGIVLSTEFSRGAPQAECVAN